MTFMCKRLNKEMNNNSCFNCFRTEERKYSSRALCKQENSVKIDDKNKLPSAVVLTEALEGQTYRTGSGVIVRVEKINDRKAVLFSVETGNEVEVPSDTIVFSDISKILDDKGYERDERGKIKLKNKERQSKETKTSYIDNLLEEEVDFDEIVKQVSEKYDDDPKKVKRLCWSRRAMLKRSQK